MKKILTKIYFSLFREKRKKLLLEKEEIGLSIWALRSDMSEQSKLKAADLVFSKIEELAMFQKATNILLYWSSSSELPTHEYIEKWSKSKNIFIPVVKNNKMKLKRYAGCESQGENKGRLITESYSGSVEIALIPGIAFDEEKYRMGHGKGLYNNILDSREIKKIGIAFDFQIIDKIPNSWNEKKMDMVVTPSMIIN
ncbi:MAG: 5-formyltetrahydrofolate cyclo-ligase [Paludibacteraceae bacterium]